MEGILHFIAMFRRRDSFTLQNVLVQWDHQPKTSKRPFRVREHLRKPIEDPNMEIEDALLPEEIEVSFQFRDLPFSSEVQLRSNAKAGKSKFRDTKLASSWPVPLYIQTGQSLLQVKDWIYRCKREHGAKYASAQPSTLPSRLLALDQYRVRLVHTEQWTDGAEKSPGEWPAYIALSHCWGDLGISFRTMNSNLPLMESGVEISLLPRTFQDAIVTTKSLGLSYIWIDSICIIQDDQQDWERESSQMADIYRSAYLTIAATRDSGLDHRPALINHPDRWKPFVAKRGEFCRSFSLRNGHDIRDLSHTGTLGENAVDVMGVGYPLLSRAWFFQERLLSPRVLHFGHSELVWECRCAFLTHDLVGGFRRSESALSVQIETDNVVFRDGNAGTSQTTDDATDDHELRYIKRKQDSYIRRRQNSLFKIQPRPIPKPPQKRYLIEKSRQQLAALQSRASTEGSVSSQSNAVKKLWVDLVEEYSRLNLTRETDRLPALSGIAASVSRIVSSNQADTKPTPRYLAGIWSSHLPQALYWTSSADARRPFQYRAPSFTWVSVESSITYAKPLDAGNRGYVACSVIGYGSVAAGVDPHGMVDDGWVDLEGYAGYATVDTLSDTRRCVLTSCHGADKQQPFELDVPIRLCQTRPAEIEHGDRVLVFMVECSKEKDLVSGFRYCVRALVLRPSSRKKDAWERVGLIYTPTYAYEYRAACSMFYDPSGWVPEKLKIRII
ncbi:heterokaryon incompatibility protein-domain-containing protein [Xylariomycetidae sp. FL2044]|nr:heterokaryon incompatibility protein-domain-containing protein [Xylariomycetidae sp. FL2044]